MQKKPPDFTHDLLRGQVGETLFEALCGGAVMRNPHKGGGDFICRLSGLQLELKTDFYDTENFFFEHYGAKEKLLLGGPWRASKQNISYFIYFFIRHGLIFVFDPEALSLALDEMRRQLIIKETPVANGSFTTTGYIVRRSNPMLPIIEKIEVPKNYLDPAPVDYPINPLIAPYLWPAKEKKKKKK